MGTMLSKQVLLKSKHKYIHISALPCIFIQEIKKSNLFSGPFYGVLAWPT